jgi:hypothetical protein
LFIAVSRAFFFDDNAVDTELFFFISSTVLRYKKIAYIGNIIFARVIEYRQYEPFIQGTITNVRKAN